MRHTPSLWAISLVGAILALGCVAGPAMAQQPAPADTYIIAQEDLLGIHVWKNPDLTTDVRVRPDGRISLPLLDDVVAAGLTAGQLKERIREGLKPFVQDPQVTVVVKEANAFKIFVVGEVLRPGPFLVRSDVTILQALSMAGGFTPFASRRRIMVLRREGEKEQVLHFDYKAVLGGQASGNFPLRPGDTIVVP